MPDKYGTSSCRSYKAAELSAENCICSIYRNLRCNLITYLHNTPHELLCIRSGAECVGRLAYMTYIPAERERERWARHYRGCRIWYTICCLTRQHRRHRQLNVNLPYLMPLCWSAYYLYCLHSKQA
jgi:hypothetical protein